MMTRIGRLLMAALVVCGMYGAFSVRAAYATHNGTAHWWSIEPSALAQVRGNASFTDNQDGTTTVAIDLDGASVARASLHPGRSIHLPAGLAAGRHAVGHGLGTPAIPGAGLLAPEHRLNAVVDGTSTTVIPIPLAQLVAED